MPSKPRLETDLLRRVSRSFYITLRLLPQGFRGPMSVGYLLARATDTIADTAQVPRDVRVDLLAQMRRCIRGDGDMQALERGIEKDFLPYQTHEGERDLLREFPFCVAALLALSEPLQAEVQEVLRHITRGQELDLERFDGVEAGTIRSLQMATELDEYTYLVAGCVGEFWTRVGFVVQAGFPQGCEAEMLERGRRYGQGLQLVNILRDLPEDLAAGRCYLPSCSGEVLVSGSSEVFAKAKIWSATAKGYLLQGLEYVSKLEGLRLRMATGLPALLGLRTLELLEDSGWSDPHTKVKVSRRELRHLLKESFVCSLHPRGWHDLVELLRPGTLSEP